MWPITKLSPWQAGKHQNPCWWRLWDVVESSKKSQYVGLDLRFSLFFVKLLFPRSRMRITFNVRLFQCQRLLSSHTWSQPTISPTTLALIPSAHSTDPRCYHLFILPPPLQPPPALAFRSVWFLDVSLYGFVFLRMLCIWGCAGGSVRSETVCVKPSYIFCLKHFRGIATPPNSKWV